MSPRDTTTGGVLEAMVLPALKRGGYDYQVQQRIGERFGGGVHVVDVIAEKDGLKYLVSMKWQQVSGTAEQKVPFEVISLADAVLSGAFSKAYLVLGGEGWKLRSFYTGGGLKSHLVHSDKVDIMTLEAFVARANQGKL
jgi:PD-(D/E)XK nuclease superfamily protein